MNRAVTTIMAGMAISQKLRCVAISYRQNIDKRNDVQDIAVVVNTPHVVEIHALQRRTLAGTVRFQ